MKTARRHKHGANGFVTQPESVVAAPAAAVLKLDLGCGPNPKEGFDGCDRLPFGGRVKHVFDLRRAPWPWADGSVAEVHSSHFLEHLTNFDGKWERVRFFNELYRVMAPGAKASLVFPHWCSNRYYGDPTHAEPFSEMGFYYLSREWRKTQAPHTDGEHNPDGYTCDFEATWGYSMHAALVGRNQEYQTNALQFWKEAAQDIIATLTKKA